jgi:outer membrane protein assembly factor BamA
VGAGFSSIESFILTAQIQQQNLFGNGQSLSLQLQLSGLRQLIQLQLIEPYFFGSDWTFAFEIFRTVRQFQSFNRESTGGSLSFGHWLGDRRFTLFAGPRVVLATWAFFFLMHLDIFLPVTLWTRAWPSRRRAVAPSRRRAVARSA